MDELKKKGKRQPDYTRGTHKIQINLYLIFNGKAVKTIKPFSENQLCGIICPGVYISIA